MSDRALNIKVEVSDEFLASVIILAAEGGIEYWAEVTDYVWYADGYLYGNTSEGEAKNTRLAFTSKEDGRQYELTVDRVAEALEEHLKRLRPDAIAAVLKNDAAELDTDDADMICQLALLNDIVYG